MTISPYENPATLTQESANRWAPASDEYFEKFQDGVYDAESYLWIVLPVQDIHESKDHPDLIVGYAGVDGICFCFREGKSGLWAWYGIADEHVLLAPTLEGLVAGWTDGTIVL